MKKFLLALMTVFMFAALVSCTEAYYEYEETTVSNIGSISSSTVEGKTTVTIEFDKTESSQVTDSRKMKIYWTTDRGRYDTLNKVFEDNGLLTGKKYIFKCSTRPEIGFVEKRDTGFAFYEGENLKYLLQSDNRHSFLDAACTVTISFGGEIIISYPNLPISPVGLPPGTLWNDNGVIRITP